MHSPFISIIIPCYNVREFVSICLDSIINQTYSNIEIIVVNDGSTDDTLTILNRFKKKDSRIVIIDKSNGGVSNARNDGLMAARAEYVLFVDGDDYLELNTCELLYEASSMDNVDLVLFGKKAIRPGREVKQPLAMKKDLYNGWKEYYAELEVIPSLVACKLIKREILVRNSIFFDAHLYLSEGLTFFLHLFPCCNKIKILPDCLYNYVKDRQDSATNAISKRDITIIDTVSQLEKYAKLHEDIIYNSLTFKQTVFSAVAAFVLYKYPRKGEFSKEARIIIKNIIGNEKFRPYLKELAYSPGVITEYKLSSWLLLNCPILFYEFIMFIVFRLQTYFRTLKVFLH